MGIQDKTLKELKQMMTDMIEEAKEATKEIKQHTQRLNELRLEHDQRVLKIMAIGEELERRSEV